MKPITLRNVPPDVERVIRRRARERGISVTKAIITLLEDAAMRERTKHAVAYRDLDHLAGTWSAHEASEFDAGARRAAALRRAPLGVSRLEPPL